MKGQYLVYERASREEERLFLETAKEVVNEIEEPKNWKKQDPKKHPGGRNVSYGFRTMLLDSPAHGLPSEGVQGDGGSSEQQPDPPEGARAGEVAGQVDDAESVREDSVGTLAKVNDAITAKFKKSEAQLGRST